MSYNGWHNWETWNVALWCDNDEGIYRERMRGKIRLPEECHDFVKEFFPEGTPDMQQDRSDWWDCSRGAVDWEEIAAHWSADYDEDEDEDEEPFFSKAAGTTINLKEAL